MATTITEKEAARLGMDIKKSGAAGERLQKDLNLLMRGVESFRAELPKMKDKAKAIKQATALVKECQDWFGRLQTVLKEWHRDSASLAELRKSPLPNAAPLLKEGEAVTRELSQLERRSDAFVKLWKDLLKQANAVGSR